MGELETTDSSCHQKRNCLILLSAFMCVLLGTSYTYIIGVLHVAVLNTYGESLILTAWLGSFFSAMFCLAGPLAGVIISSFSSRACIITGAILNLIGFGLSSVAPNVYVLFATYGAIAGIGHSLEYVGAMVAVGYHFKELRSLATGITVTGSGLGVIIFPPLSQFLLDIYGLNGTFLLLGAITFQSAVFAMFLRPHPSEIEIKISWNENRNVNRCQIMKTLMDHLKLLKNISFVFFCVSIICWSSALNTFLIFIPDVFQFNGIPSLEASFLVSLFGLGSSLSKILTGLASVEGALDGKVIYFGSFGILGAISFFGLLMMKDPIGRAFLCFLLGLYSAGAWTLLSPVAIDIVGLSRFSIAVGVEMFSAGIGFLSGPVIAGAILGKLIYSHLLVYVGVLFFSTCVFGILTVIFLQPQQDAEANVTADTENSTQETSTFLSKPFYGSHYSLAMSFKGSDFAINVK